MLQPRVALKNGRKLASVSPIQTTRYQSSNALHGALSLKFERLKTSARALYALAETGASGGVVRRKICADAPHRPQIVSSNSKSIAFRAMDEKRAHRESEETCARNAVDFISSSPPASG